MCRSVSWSVCRSVSLSVGLCADRSVGRFVGLFVCRSVGRSADRSSWSVCRSVCLPIGQSVGLSVCRSVSWSVCRSVSLSVWLSGRQTESLRMKVFAILRRFLATVFRGSVSPLNSLVKTGSDWYILYNYNITTLALNFNLSAHACIRRSEKRRTETIRPFGCYSARADLGLLLIGQSCFFRNSFGT